MSIEYITIILLCYFGLLYLISRLSAKKSDAATFFIANRKSPWMLVSYGMIGVSISGITFISVPGQVVVNQFSYLQMVLGFAVGLIIVAYILLPVFYKIKAISIYSFLESRFGSRSHKTATILFLVAQTTTAAFKLFLMAQVLQLMLFDQLNVPFWLTTLLTLLLIWLYTHRGGIKTVIVTDTLQTTFLLAALGLSIWSIGSHLDVSAIDLYRVMDTEGISKVFFWSWDDPKNFFKLFFTGILLTVMTNGLDQSVMQKHLTCKDLASSQKNIITLAVILVVVNFLFLFLGGALQVFSASEGISLPELTDNIFPSIATEHLGMVTGTFFLLGIAAAAYSSADSSLTGLTTSFCVDILKFNIEEDRTLLRNVVHLGFSLLIFVIIIVFSIMNNESVLYQFIRASGFIYGPLLSLFAMGIYSKRKVRDKMVPYIAVGAPLLCILIDQNSVNWFGYKFGYDILLLNTLIASIALYIFSSKTFKI
ncbi:MAG: sodium:solute symporter [Flavobacteriaceae bacterium]|nr:sodium:solute symporter [Flavobacteriaceae bacterium]